MNEPMRSYLSRFGLVAAPAFVLWKNGRDGWEAMGSSDYEHELWPLVNRFKEGTVLPRGVRPKGF